jgi:hypothetical protein
MSFQHHEPRLHAKHEEGGHQGPYGVDGIHHGSFVCGIGTLRMRRRAAQYGRQEAHGNQDKQQTNDLTTEHAEGKTPFLSFGQFDHRSKLIVPTE